MEKEPTTVTISRETFLDIAGTAYASFFLNELLVRLILEAGLVSPQITQQKLDELLANVRSKQNDLVRTAIPKLEALSTFLRKTSQLHSLS